MKTSRKRRFSPPDGRMEIQPANRLSKCEKKMLQEPTKKGAELKQRQLPWGSLSSDMPNDAAALTDVSSDCGNPAAG